MVTQINTIFLTNDFKVMDLDNFVDHTWEILFTYTVQVGWLGVGRSVKDCFESFGSADVEVIISNEIIEYTWSIVSDFVLTTLCPSQIAINIWHNNTSF